MRKRDHPDEATLAELLIGELTQDTKGLEATKAHVESCEVCKGRVAAMRTTRARPEESKVRQAAAVEKLIRDERAAAAALIGELLSGPAAWWRTRVFNKQETLTYGLAVALVERAVSLLDTSPPEALEASSIAVDVAERLRVDAYPEDLVISARADAWREHAYTLFYVGRLSEAATALEMSEQLYRQVPVPEMDLARTSLIRAALLLAWDKAADAIPLAQHAGEVFDQFGDRPRYVNARMTEGALRYRAGDMAGALAIWLELEHEPSLQHTASLGSLLHNVGHAYRDMKEFARARTYLDRALVEFGARGAHVEQVRTRWVLGEMLVMTGELVDGLAILRRARREFEKLAMELEAGLVGLAMAEAMLIAGQTDEVAKVCRTVLDRFVREGMMSRAITALAYLREAVAAEKATPAMIREVRDFLGALPQNPRRTSNLPAM
jgi:tetratricopeptide (TPR) repeat protein